MRTKKPMPDFDLRDELLAILRQKPNPNQETIDQISKSLSVDGKMSAQQISVVKDLIRQFSIESEHQFGYEVGAETSLDEE